MTRSLLITLLLFIFCNNTLGQTEKKLHKNFINNIYSTSLVEMPTYTLLKELCTDFPHRLSGSKGSEGAINWSKDKMEKFGFDNIFLQEVMVEHWVRGEKEEAYISDDSGNKIDLSILALGRSIATPEKGISAEVVEVHSLQEVAELGREKIAGKIVFYNYPFEQQHVRTFSGYSGTVSQRSKGPSQAARYGAIAAVIRSVSSANDDFPHTGGLIYDDDAPHIPAGALGNHSADKLAKILKGNPGQELFIKINSQMLPDIKSYNVIGEIKGSEHPDKFIIVGGHLDAWDVGQGAHDDGAGSMQSISVLKVLKKLGYKPKHTLRAVLFTNEENGLAGGKEYVKQAIKNNEDHVIAIESDAGGFTPRAFGLKCADSTMAKMQEWLKFFPEYTIGFIKKGFGGPDINPLHKADGTPVCGLVPDSQRYFDIHHSPADILDAVNRRELELGTASMATLVYLVDQFGL